MAGEKVEFVYKKCSGPACELVCDRPGGIPRGPQYLYVPEGTGTVFCSMECQDYYIAKLNKGA